MHGNWKYTGDFLSKFTGVQWISSIWRLRLSLTSVIEHQLQRYHQIRQYELLRIGQEWGILCHGMGCVSLLQLALPILHNIYVVDRSYLVQHVGGRGVRVLFSTAIISRIGLQCYLITAHWLILYAYLLMIVFIFSHMTTRGGYIYSLMGDSVNSLFWGSDLDPPPKVGPGLPLMPPEWIPLSL